MSIYRLAGPVLRLFSPERAHSLAIHALKAGLVPGAPAFASPRLAQSIWGLNFPTPIGLAAGFDKNADVPGAMLNQGFGFVEVGSITPKAQPGNPKPRLFRLTEDQGVINRMGFNNKGMENAAANLINRPARGIIGVNLGKNKTTEDAAADYELGVATLAPYADYIVINVSSPNTPGLRALQGKAPLTELIQRVQVALADATPEGTPPLLLKIAPDLTEEDKRDIAEVALDLRLDGIIATNTTISRPASLQSADKAETGGLSGAPVFDLSTALLRDMYRLTEGKITLIGAGGVRDAQTALAKIRAGASLVQLYSALVYAGPQLAHDIAKEIDTILETQGIAHISDLIGRDAT